VYYKDYRIDTIERQHGRWRAIVRRRDGRKIVVDGGQCHDFLTTPYDSFSARHAIEGACKAIDDGVPIKRNGSRNGRP
jgi:hypothetical protein